MTAVESPRRCPVYVPGERCALEEGREEICARAGADGTEGAPLVSKPIDVSHRVRHCEEHEDCLSSPALARSCAKRDNCKTFRVPYLDWVRPFQPPLHHERLVVDGVESLSNIDSGSFLTGDLAFVRSSSMMYTLVRDSMAAVNGETVVASNTVSNTSNAPGRWIAMR